MILFHQAALVEKARVSGQLFARGGNLPESKINPENELPQSKGKFQGIMPSPCCGEAMVMIGKSNGRGLIQICPICGKTKKEVKLELTKNRRGTKT